jgi:hypothetical protein
MAIFSAFYAYLAIFASGALYVSLSALPKSAQLLLIGIMRRGMFFIDKFC